MSIFLLILLLAVFGGSIISTQVAYAAENFIVTTTGDTSDSNIGDDVCDDGTGECSLRAAIEQANATVGADSISFNILPLDGAVKTIQPNSFYPLITDQLTIDGFSQDDALPNSAVSPNPLNGELRIEIDGTNTAALLPVAVSGFDFGAGSDDSLVRGLVINNFTHDAVHLSAASGVRVEGNYLGTDPTGMIDEGNTWSGISGVGEDAVIGGLTPDKRNLISGNESSGAYPYSGWVIQGNYVGTDVTGTGALGNSFLGGPGGMSIDYAEDVLVGGTAVGATNVFSGNYNQGMAPFDCSNLVIQGNLIGTDYTGTQELPNGSIGINLNDSDDVQIGGDTAAERNIISNSGSDGIYFDTNTDVRIQGNYIGTDITGTVDMGNVGAGVASGSNNVDILIGGAGVGEGNLIAYNTFAGVGIYPFASIQDNSIIGNSIHSNVGPGIILGVGANNDVGDTDAGPNDYLNYPLFDVVEEVAGDTVIDYTVDIPAGNYRIEFFSNTVRDLSGNGEGETLIGTQNIATVGGSYSTSHTISGIGYTFLSATVTEIDGSTPSGFGSSSAFGGYLPIQADVSLSVEILNPNSVAVEEEMTYRFTVKNVGPDEFDLSVMSGSNAPLNSLALIITPPEITYVNESTADVSCASIGLASMLGPPMANHSDHALIACSYSGSIVLSAGDTFSFDVIFQTELNSDLVFDLPTLQVPQSADPDAFAFNVALNSGEDIIDLLGGEMNNFPVALFPIPATPTNSETVVPAPNSGVIGALVATGSEPFTLVIFSVGLLIFGWYLVRKVRHPRRLVR